MKHAPTRLTALALLLPALLAPVLRADPPVIAPPPPAPDEVLDRSYLYEVVRYLYRWYLDEGDIERIAPQPVLRFWVRALHPQMDAGDRSRFAEILLPQLGISVKVKKSDYVIEEVDLPIRTGNFKIINVARIDLPDAQPGDCALVEVDMAEMREYLFRTRREAAFPDLALRQRLRVALRDEFLAALRFQKKDIPEGDQISHIAPLSPVANEIWAFWETGKMLLRVSSDIDLANPAVWEHETLTFRTYDIEEQTVVSLEEAAGSNAYLTRDQVGRALFNCIIFGLRAVVPPLDQDLPGAAAPQP